MHLDEPITYLEHTADVGFEVRAHEVVDLFRLGAEALTAVFVDPHGDTATNARAIEVHAHDRESLYVRWLNELLFLFDTEKFFAVTISDLTLEQNEDAFSIRAIVHGTTFDPERHEFKMYVKAVTYHHVEIGKTDAHFRARCYIDV